MTNKRPRISPWLTQVITDFMKSDDSKDLNKDYIQTSSLEERSWDEYVIAEALKWEANRRPFLKTSVWDLAISDTTKEGLYMLYIDTVADLLQFSLDELTYFTQFVDIRTREVDNYMYKKVLRMDAKGFKTQKYSFLKITRNYRGSYVSDAMKVFDNESLLTDFNLDRPLLNHEWWFEEFYNNYCRTEDEDLLEKSLKHVTFRVKHPDEKLGPYDEFIHAVYEYWFSYRGCCIKQEIEMEVEEPTIPKCASEINLHSNALLLSLKKASIRALIALLRRSSFLCGSSIADFLKADLDKKLDIAEMEVDSTMQLLLILYVEIGVDLESLVIDLKEQKRQGICSDDDFYVGIMNPWLARKIREYRKYHSDKQIRTAYEKATEERPELLWIRFMGEQALQYATQKNPYLSTYVEDSDLPDDIKESLDKKGIILVSDLLQYTTRDLYEIFDDDEAKLNTLNNVLRLHYLRIYECDAPTHKIFSPQ